MNPTQCAEFIHSCTGDYCKADDNRVRTVFNTFDDDNDGYLTLDNFLMFYQTACIQRPLVVWSNLRAKHVRNDLKSIDEIEISQVDVKTLPRYILNKDSNFY